MSTLVVRHNPEWFESHREVFKRMSEHMFSMKYDESKFRDRFYHAGVNVCNLLTAKRFDQTFLKFDG